MGVMSTKKHVVQHTFDVLSKTDSEVQISAAVIVCHHLCFDLVEMSGLPASSG